MPLQLEEKDLDKLIVVGDKVLVKPKNPDSKTKSGLFLPPSVHEKETAHSGYIISVGPGIPIPTIAGIEEETWKETKNEANYIPLQAQAGDLAVYLNTNGIEIELKGEKYIILPHSAILMLIRDEQLFS